MVRNCYGDRKYIMFINDWIKNKDGSYVIAEISQNHDGSLGQAHAYIDAAADAGVDAVKFQTHIASEESTVFEPFRVNFSYADKTRYDYWKRMEFTMEQWKELYGHAMERNIDFLSSPFSLKALSMLDEIGVPAWKFGSGEVFNNQLLEAAIETGKPILLSTGLSTFKEIDNQVEKVEAGGNELILFYCVTAYPSRAYMIDINKIKEFSQRYGCVIGISDHSATIYPSLAAVTLGAKVVEVHVTLSSYMFGPDVKASVTIDKLKDIVEGVHYIDQMKKTQIDLNFRDDNRKELKAMFSKSFYYRRNLNKNQVVCLSDLVLKKPNIGVNETSVGEILGKRLKRDVAADGIVRVEDFQNE